MAGAQISCGAFIDTFLPGDYPVFVPQIKGPLITRADYEEMPEGPPYFQVIEGDLIMSPSPNLFHQDIVGQVFLLLSSHVKQRKLGRVFVAPVDVFLGDTNVYQPDVIFISQERSHFLTQRGIEGAPDLVVEILSNSTSKYDKGPKRKVYARAGVRELWLIDPEAKTVQVLELAKEPEMPGTVHSVKSVFESRLLPGLVIKTEEVFSGAG